MAQTAFSAPAKYYLEHILAAWFHAFTIRSAQHRAT
jgi:hypothetical protein